LQKNYCDNICTSWHRNLGLAQVLGVTCLSSKCRYCHTESVLQLYFSQFLELIVALVLSHPDDFQPGMSTSSQ
jgi:hypothetical protein